MALLKQLLPGFEDNSNRRTVRKKWVEDLIKNPEANRNFRFDRLKSEEMVILLSKRPDLINRCDLRKISSSSLDNRSDAAKIIIAQPQLLPYFPPDKIINRRDILNYPGLLDRINDIWKAAHYNVIISDWIYKSEDWIDILRYHPGLWDHSPKKFASHEWAELIKYQPGFWDYSPKKFASYEWAWIIKDQPGFFDYSPKEFSSQEWAWIIDSQPQLADQCPWKDMIITPPENPPKIPKTRYPELWDHVFHHSFWKKCLFKYPDMILAHRPDWKEYYNPDNLVDLVNLDYWSEFDGEELGDIFHSNPEIDKMSDFPEVFNSARWEDILSYFPQFTKYCDVKKYLPKVSDYLIARNPELSKIFDLDEIDMNMFLEYSSEDCRDFIKSHPQQTVKFLTYLYGYDRTEILYDHPEYLLRQTGRAYSFVNGVITFVAANVWDFEKTGLDSMCNIVYSCLHARLPPTRFALFGDPVDYISPAEFLLKSVMDPDNAELNLIFKVYPDNWKYLSEILDTDPDAFSRIIKHNGFFFFMIAEAPQESLKRFIDVIPDPAAYRDRKGNTLLHAALLRAVFNNIRALLDADNPYRAEYDCLVKRGCDPDKKNKSGFSCNDLIDLIRQFVNKMS